ncbi:VOC family protein [Paenibacillus sp. JDR-2]|uniref:VOC family protein n=1 Tax=Paenibacillus sp. (strain JDR-2) TaxID=324057 RepID=UPI0001AAF76E|nr:VOC family protein [Paenibacillus sp. JDR-2]ACT01945.1 methylmalonyl-CoA epimerase [Paenibacillus sp. JDR-2]
MSQSAIGTKMITQIGILVHDIEAVSEAYANFFGVEKPGWNWTDTPDKAQTEFQGEPSQARAKLAFFNMDSLQLELIEPDLHPSTWRNYLEEHGEGPHHIAFVVEGMKEKIAIMESKGMKLQQKGEYTGGRYAYFDSVPQLKVLIELLENDK